MGNRNNDEDYNRLRRTKDYQYEEKNEEEYRGPVGVNNDEPRALSSDPNSSSLRSVNSDVPVKGLQSVANAEEYESRKRKRSNPTQTPEQEYKEAEDGKKIAEHSGQPEAPASNSPNTEGDSADASTPEDSRKAGQEEEDALSKMVKAFKQKEKEEEEKKQHANLHIVEHAVPTTSKPSLQAHIGKIYQY